MKTSEIESMGVNLRRRREAAGLTLAQVARAAKLCAATVATAERWYPATTLDDPAPTLRTLYQICAALDFMNCPEVPI